MSKAEEESPAGSAEVLYVPTGILGFAATPSALLIFGERGTGRLEGDGTRLAIASFDEAASGREAVAADGALVRSGAAARRAISAGEPRPVQVLGGVDGYLATSGTLSCPSCFERARGRHGLRPVDAAAISPPPLLAALRWIARVVRRSQEQGWWVRFDARSPGQWQLLLVPWERRGGCARCRPEVSPSGVLDLVDPLRGPIVGMVTGEGRAIACIVDARVPTEPRLVGGQSTGSAAAGPVVISIAEALERHAFFTDAPDLETTAASQLAKEAVVLPAELGAFHAFQYARGLAQGVPFDPSAPICWKRARDLDSGVPVLIPHDGGARPAQLWRGTTSGYATHRTRDEALVHAILELIERDAALAAWLARLAGEPVDVSARQGVRELASQGWEARCHWLPSDLGVPVALATLTATRDAAVPRGATVVGTAAHLHEENAVARAIAEAGQSRILLLSLCGAPKAVPAGPYDHPLLYGRAGGRRHFAFLDQPASGAGARTRRSPVGEPLDDLLGRLRQAGKRVLWYESPVGASSVLTVVRAIVPGLLPIGFGPTSHLRLGCYPSRIQELAGKQRPLPLRRSPHPF